LLRQNRRRNLSSDLPIATIAFTTLTLAAVLALASVIPAHAQTFTVIHNFTGGNDGANPQAGLAMDAHGNFYGTTNAGGHTGDGVVFKMTNRGSGWILSPLFNFDLSTNGAGPYGRVFLASDGTLYGTTQYGPIQGGCTVNPGNGCGTAYRLQPPPTAPRSTEVIWRETVLHIFQGPDGFQPQGDLTFDQAGNIYGTTISGGNGSNCSGGCGVVYELAPSGGGYTQSVLYSFQNNGDGFDVYGGVVFDNSGNLLGVVQNGGLNTRGAIYELSPSGSGWAERTAYAFPLNEVTGAFPIGGLINDGAGNLYGTTSQGGTFYGTAFELSPGGGGWTLNSLYDFAPPGSNVGPVEKLYLGTDGNLYGTSYSSGPNNRGSVFKLTPTNGSWTYTSLHDFTGGSDGGYPISNVVMDSSGNLYGTASSAGGGNCDAGCGVVWEITP
jgi:uncharacterized repeat protein (TIGR03803 family)